jgi:ComF family protein
MPIIASRILSLLSPLQLQPFSGWLSRYLLPSPCLLCGGKLTSPPMTSLCPGCQDLLPRLDNYKCQCCSLPLTTPAPLCGQCLQHPAAFQKSMIPFRYAYPLDFMIQKFKYNQHLACGQSLAELLLDSARQQLNLGTIAQPEFLVPIPLHWRRRWQRGFNQAEQLARHLGSGLDIPVLDACIRHTHSHSQKGLNRRERQRNLRRAFRLHPRFGQKIIGKHIALVDDVVTTSATVRALSELLIKGGAKQVDVWALARTPAADSLPNTNT